MPAVEKPAIIRVKHPVESKPFAVHAERNKAREYEHKPFRMGQIALPIILRPIIGVLDADVRAPESRIFFKIGCDKIHGIRNHVNRLARRQVHCFSQRQKSCLILASCCQGEVGIPIQAEVMPVSGP